MLPLISTDRFPNEVLSDLGNRDVSLWVHTPSETLDQHTLADLVRLPWHEVYLSNVDSSLIQELTHDTDPNLLRKRGFIQLVQTNPSHLSLPPRSLPVYVLDTNAAAESEFDRSLRRNTMLGYLRRSSVRRLLFVTNDDAAPPPELSSLLDSSFYPYLSFVSATERGASQISTWIAQTVPGPSKLLVRMPPLDFVQQLIDRYVESYIADRLLVRMRTPQGATQLVDLTSVDDVERPILTYYELIRERDLAYISPEELTEDEFNEFFEGSLSSWRPYGSCLPWIQDHTAVTEVKKILHRLDTIGPTENKVAYITSEPGAGGTTLARQIAWGVACEGYPTLVAKDIPFPPDALPVVGFLNRVNDVISTADREKKESQSAHGEKRIIYETPWVVVFDRSHWEQRDTDLRRFLSEFARSGRPVVLLVVSGPFRPLSLYTEAHETEIAALTHIIDSGKARQLGIHLNKYLRVFGKERRAEEWATFHDRHSVQHMGSRASFWIALSFWLRTNRNLTENIQDWIYRVFCDHAESASMKNALVEIAAMSSVRLPVNERLLPRSGNEWPIGLHLEDSRKNLTALGLVRLSVDGEKYWGLAHDILGRLLINALFYDYKTRVELEYGEARDPEHLRFLALRRIAVKPEIGEVSNRTLAEEFATTIFKIDPGQGAGAFASIWREVLQALDQMPTMVRDSSRLFRHHTAISRRRIAMLEGPSYNVSLEEQISLLERAVNDIEFSIYSIDRKPGDEPDLNLFNSLANAYLNLADAKTRVPVPREEILRLRASANDATHRAYTENPTSPFVVETHIKNLLGIARSEPDHTISSCLEALQATYEALRGERDLLRMPQLTMLAQQALSLLFTQAAREGPILEPRTALEVLLRAWQILSNDDGAQIGEHLLDIPLHTADQALAALEHPAGKGDLQILRLRYGVLSSARPFEFRRRIELVEGLHATDVRLSPQLRLEYALLLYQVGRAVEGDEQFRDLRRLWRNSEHFVRVTTPLDWLRHDETETLLAVQAIVDSDQSHRPMAKVREFGNRVCPFRPEEFDVRNMRPGHRFRARVSFGHNGPFLRPLGAQPRRVQS